MMKLRPGDIIYAEKGRYVGPVAVLANAHRKGGVRLTGVTTRRETADAHRARLRRAADSPSAASSCPPTSRRTATTSSGRWRTGWSRPRPSRTRASRRRGAEDQPLTHPVEDDPELDDRLKAADQAERVAREVDELRQRVRGRSQSIARDFDQVLGVLRASGATSTAGRSPTAGEILARTFHEMRSAGGRVPSPGAARRPRPADARRRSPACSCTSTAAPKRRPRRGTRRPMARRRWQSIARISYDLQDTEEAAGLSVHRPPDPTFVAVAYAWAAGEGFAEVVAEEELSGGDFVRTMKQLIDLRAPVGDRRPVEGDTASGRAGRRGAVPRRGRRVQRARGARPTGDDPQG